jgi:hypothetical protein
MSTEDTNTTPSQHDAKLLVRRSLPLSNTDLWAMSKEIVAALKAAVEMPPDKVDKVWFEQLEDDWFDWLEEKLMGNDA